MANIFKIHPAIGISRLGDSTTEFCLAPERALGLPVECDDQGRVLLDDQGNERPIDMFKDSRGRIKRQAARFRVYVYKDANDEIGRELKVGDEVEVYKWQTGEYYHAIVLDIEWTVYLANKKASWYQLKESAGEYGAAPKQSLRNSTIKDAAARQRLIIDPGPQTVSYSSGVPARAKFSKNTNSVFPQSFPATLSPKKVETLGEIIVNKQDNYNRLIVLGGHGNSGSFKSSSGESRIDTFANGDGWFDDVSDGPVTANLCLQHLLDDSDSERDLSPFMIPVDDPAWVLVTYPGYVPEIDNMVTIDDIIYDLALREMDYNSEIYGPLKDERHSSAETLLKGWNKEYYPYFYRDIWPILCHPNVYQWLTVFNPANGGDPYSTAADDHSNFNFDVISVPQYAGQDLVERLKNAEGRQHIYDILRKPAPENLFHAPSHNKISSPSLLTPQQPGDTLSESQPRFLRLTDTQLFFLQQWVDGNFINEKCAGLSLQIDSLPASGSDLDRNVLRTVLNGAFCLGKEVCWVIRNPAIYAKPYRIKHAAYEPGVLSQPAAISRANKASDFSLGLQPGDLTKYSALPWQADFNESANQDVDISYETWVKNSLIGTRYTIPTDVEKGVFWWAAHRPMEVFLPMSAPFGNLARNKAPWVFTTPKTTADDLQAATAWVALGFVEKTNSSENPKLVELVGNDGNDNFSMPPDRLS